MPLVIFVIVFVTITVKTRLQPKLYRYFLLKPSSSCFMLHLQQLSFSYFQLAQLIEYSAGVFLLLLLLLLGRFSIFPFGISVLQCSDTVGWVILPVKSLPDMTYDVFGETLNLPRPIKSVGHIQLLTGIRILSSLIIFMIN